MSIWKAERCDRGAFGAGGGTACMPHTTVGLHSVCVAPPHAAVAFTGPGAALPVADLCTCSPRGGCWSFASCLILNHRAYDVIFPLACSLRSTPEAADPRTSRYTLHNSSSTQCTVSFLSFFYFLVVGVMHSVLPQA